MPGNYLQPAFEGSEPLFLVPHSLAMPENCGSSFIAEGHRVNTASAISRRDARSLCKTCREQGERRGKKSWHAECVDFIGMR